MNVLDVFSGIGGFSYGLEQAGCVTRAFCEIEPYCQRILRRHWSSVPIYLDIRTLTLDQLQRDHIPPIDVLCGGFPCQDISVANPHRVGIVGLRSGLWLEFKRLIAEVKPRYAIIENVAALCRQGLTLVLQHLCEVGYDAEWHCIPASALGAPHRRDRIWIIAYPTGTRLSGCLLQSTHIACQGKKEFHQFGDTSVSCGVDWRCDIGRVYVGDGLSPRLARPRVKVLGNAIVPLMAKRIGQALMEATE